METSRRAAGNGARDSPENELEWQKLERRRVAPDRMGWDTVRQALRERKPDTFEIYRRRLLETLRSRVDAGMAAQSGAAWEVSELLSQVGNTILRAHFRHSRSSENVWENATADSLPEAESYIEHRRSQAKALRIACSDPESGTPFRYGISEEESLYRFKGWNVRELAAFGGDTVRLLRNPEGRTVGLSAILPIHRGTIPYLLQSPLSSPYFRTLPPERMKMLETGPEHPAGKFIFAVDIIDLEQWDLRSDIVHTVMEHILAGSLLIASPPPLPYYADSHLCMGYRPVPGAEHNAYGGAAAASTYLLDTRGGQWASFLDKVTAPEAGGYPPYPELSGQHAKCASIALTPREQEVADLLVTGLTNIEIANRLFISVAAVKKHVNAMLQKSGLKNRTQLAAALLDTGNE